GGDAGRAERVTRGDRCGVRATPRRRHASQRRHQSRRGEVRDAQERGLPDVGRGGAKGGTRTPTAVNHWLLKPARLPVPPLSHAYGRGRDSHATPSGMSIAVSKFLWVHVF